MSRLRSILQLYTQCLEKWKEERGEESVLTLGSMSLRLPLPVMKSVHNRLGRGTLGNSENLKNSLCIGIYVTCRNRAQIKFDLHKC